jgi:hypothetical protein
MVRVPSAMLSALTDYSEAHGVPIAVQVRMAITVMLRERAEKKPEKPLASSTASVHPGKIRIRMR